MIVAPLYRPKPLPVAAPCASLRVALFSGNYNYVMDGPVRALNMLIGHLLKRGHQALIVAPTREFLRTLPLGKLPDRKDFKYYGLNHDERIRNWKIAMSEGQRLRDELAAFAAKPDPAQVKPI